MASGQSPHTLLETPPKSTVIAVEIRMERRFDTQAQVPMARIECVHHSRRVPLTYET